MEGRSIEIAKQIFGDNFIGREELMSIDSTFLFDSGKLINLQLPKIHISEEELKRCAQTHYLILVFPFLKDQKLLSIKFMREIFGVDSVTFEPCFYNQDWYINEEFVSTNNLEYKWVLVRKNVIEENRGILPFDFSSFYSASLIVYAFFVVKLTKGYTLFENDYVWTSDKDVNGDIVYVGKYKDPLGVAKNGFEIHRHLSLKMNYSTI